MRYITILAFLLVSGCSQSIEKNSLAKACLLKPETGRCRADMPRYYFDAASSSCKRFIWGGCGGVVPFEREADCISMCVKKMDNHYLEKLQESLLQWRDHKQQKGSAYQYSSEFSSWVGFGNETTIFVRDDAVVRREYRAWDADRRETMHWIEDVPDKLGIHKEGAPLQTVEKLYEDCRDILATKNNEENDIHLGFDANGILGYCLFAPKNCADDCSSGVRINNLVFVD